MRSRPAQYRRHPSQRWILWGCSGHRPALAERPRRGNRRARVSSGAIEHIPLIRVRNLAESVNELKDAGLEVIGADMEGSPIGEHHPHKRTALLFGSEGKGLRRLVRERCDKLLKIPGGGPVASLNVGAAAAIFL